MQITLNGNTQNMRTLAAVVDARVPLNASWLQIQMASGNNSGGVEVGGANMDGTGLGRDMILAPGESNLWEVETGKSLTEIYLRGTSGDKVNISYVRR